MGPVIIYNNDGGIVRAFRNVPGLTLLSVNHLNLLKIAPGGHVGRLLVWTESAFRKLDNLFGTFTKKSTVKKGFSLPYPKMTNTDFSRLIRSDEISKVNFNIFKYILNKLFFTNFRWFDARVNKLRLPRYIVIH